jgi:hypothetical protein
MVKCKGQEAVQRSACFSQYEAARAIKELKQAGISDFKLKTGVMLKKDDRGNVSLLETKDRHLLGTAVGTATGALIGLRLSASRTVRAQ